MARGIDPLRLAAYGALAGLPAFSAVIFSAPLEAGWLFRAGALGIGFGGGLFAVGTLYCAMRMEGGGGEGGDRKPPAAAPATAPELDPEEQEALAARVVAEGLSVRATEEAVTLANHGGNKKPANPRRKPIQMPGLQDVAERLSGTYDTRVSVSLGKRKGKIVVEFGSVEDLHRIVGLMDPSAAK